MSMPHTLTHAPFESSINRSTPRCYGNRRQNFRMNEHIPAPSGFFDAVLRVISRHPAGVARKGIYEAVADLMGLTPEQRSIVLPSGKHAAYRHRVGWALTMLKQAGLLHSVALGVWGMTDAGLKLVGERPQGLTDADRRDIARRVREFSAKDDADDETAALAAPHTDPDQSPEERIDAAIDTLRREVSRELLDLIGQSSPAFFETLVLDLLHALGYGTGRQDLRRVGGSGDGGIDGIIFLASAAHDR